MAASVDRAKGAPKPPLADRAKTWLPFVAGFLCLSLLAIATVSLFDVNAEPKSPASGHVTSVGAQGFAGLRRLLEAQGASIRLNRFEDGSKDVDRGDLEIITLDDDGGVFAGEYDRGGDKVRNNNQASASASASGEASASSENSASMSSADSADARQRLRRMMSGSADDGYAVPDTRRVDHVLHHPLGRAMLVVAPKWNIMAATGPQGRWAQGADVMPTDDVSNILAVLAPVTWKPIDKTQVTVRPKVEIGARTDDANTSENSDDDAPTAMLDRVPYVITRAKGVGDTVLSPDTAGPVHGAVRTGSIDRLQSVTGPNLVPVLTGPHGEVLLSRVVVTGGRPQTAVPVYLLSDPDLLDNQVLADPARTVTALNLVKALTPPVPAGKKPAYVFNLTFNGMGFDHDLLHALSRPPYIAVPISLLIAALGLMWAAFARFGPPVLEDMRPALGRGVRILADNAARLMAVTLKEARLGPAYAQLMRDQVLKIRGYRQIDARESADDLADRISQIYKATHRYSDLRAQAARVMTVHQLIDVALRLHAWKVEIGQDTGPNNTGKNKTGQNTAGKTESHLANH
jgi:hypothetical protein